MLVLVRNLEQLAGEMMGGAGAGGAVVQLARVGLGVGDELGQRLGRDLIRIDDDHLRRPRDQGHRNKILLDVVIEVGIERRCNGVMRRAHEEGVSVRSGLGRGRCANGAACAGAVFDQHAFAQLCVELGCERARKGIGAAAGRERHDEGDGLVRPCLGLGVAGHGGNARHNSKQGVPNKGWLHGVFLLTLQGLDYRACVRALAEPSFFCRMIPGDGSERTGRRRSALYAGCHT